MSAIESTEIQESALELTTVLAAFKLYGSSDLFKVIRTATIEAEKRAKEESKGPKKPKGPTPHQLQKPKAWVQYVLNYSAENGWEQFICVNKKSGEEIVMPASEEKDGKHAFPNGKPLILTQAMSLSKQMWQAKAKTGTHEAVYREFETEFASRPVEESVVAAEPAAKPVMIRKTAEEKAAELEKKKTEAAEKRAAIKAAKDAAKAPKAAPKAAVKAAAAPAKAVAAPAAAGVKPGPKKKVAPKVEEWSCPSDGNVYPWPYKGKKFLRNMDNQVWEEDAEGGCGDWAGMFLPTEDRIDESAADPFADESDEEESAEEVMDTQ